MPKKPAIPKIYRDCADVPLVPNAEHPVCVRCTMHCGKANPFIKFEGSDNPLLTVVFEGPSRKEDALGELASDGWNLNVRNTLEKIAKRLNFPVDRIRYAAVTLCAAGPKDVIKTKGNFCRWFLMDDLIKHPPNVIMPVGTAAAGLLTHKGNTQDWQGRPVLWRGWPDDWITDARFDEGHPIFGPAPDSKTWLISIRHPRLVAMDGTQAARQAWAEAMCLAMDYAETPPEHPNYNRPYFDLTTEVARITEKLNWIISHPGTLLSFDTETTGLQPWAPDARIVLMMFRWDTDDGPASIAFPWEHAESPLLPYVDQLTPLILDALYASRLQGHNLTFDVQFVVARLKANIRRISDAMLRDTWHMHFTYRQLRESMGLDSMPYWWCPEWGGYEEEMTLLIDKLPALQPDKGGHYANCPPEKWDTHLKPYIMGDVEVVHLSAPRLEEVLAETTSYRIPLASVNTRGKFRYYKTPTRNFVYNRIMAPANRLLTKLMCRGMFVDRAELELQEAETPKRIRELKQDVRAADPRIIQWCDSMEATVPDWQFDLDKPAVLKELLFDVLKLPIKRLTKGGRKTYGEEPEKWKSVPHKDLVAAAAADKFTLNSMAAEHAELRPLLEYRKINKIYTTYIRPMRNLFTPGIDKKHRTKPPIYMPDGCVHTSFMLCGTRGGRLSSRSPNLQNIAKDGVVKALYASRFGLEGAIYHCDLSQIELRLLAAACGDQSMVEAYMRKMDLHSLTCSKIFRIPYAEFSEEHQLWLQDNGHDKKIKEMSLKRRVAKVVNFLTGYGGGALGLQNVLAAQQIYLSMEECEEIIESFFDNYPALRDHIAFYKNFVQENALAVSLTGRVRLFPEVFSSDRQIASKALRSGYNHLIQTTASDIMLACLIVIEQCMEAAQLESMLISTVHDSLVIDAKRDELTAIHEICGDVFSNIPEVMQIAYGDDYDTSWMFVPLSGDRAVGSSYLEEKKIRADAETGLVDWERLLHRG